MTVKLREFLGQTAHVHRQSRYDSMLSCLSARLKADAALHWAKETMLKVPYFARPGAVEDEFLASAALALTSSVFCRTEYIPVENLLIIERGIAARDGRITVKGSCLGTDMILASIAFRDLDPAIALTFVVQVATLEKKALDALLSNYPLARRELRASSFKLAFRRAILQLAKIIAKNRALGVPTSISEAFVSIRKAKQRTAIDHILLREPTRRVLQKSIGDLSERTEEIAHEGVRAHEELTSRVRALDANVRGLDSKMDRIIGALESGMGAALTPPAEAPPAATAPELAEPSCGGRPRYASGYSRSSAPRGGWPSGHGVVQGPVVC